MTRLVPVTLLMAVLTASRVASADLNNGATLVFEKRAIYDTDEKKFVEPTANSDELRQAFSLAGCTCAQAHLGATPGDNNTSSIGWFRYLVRETAQSGVTKPVDFWVGTACDTDDTRNGTNTTCLQVDSVPDLDSSFYKTGGHDTYFNLYEVLTAKSSTTSAECPRSDAVTAPIYAFVNTTGTLNTYDYKATQTAGALSTDTTTATAVDTNPPPLPTEIKALGSDSAIVLQWKLPDSNLNDIAAYQALCTTIDDQPISDSPAADPRFVATKSLCPEATAPDVETLAAAAIAVVDGDAEVTAPPQGFVDLDRSFICGDSGTGTATSLRIDGLEDGKQYKVALLAIDLHGNFRGVYINRTVTPVPSIDFWEDLHDRGSGVEGGLCLLAETYGDDSSLTNTLRSFRDGTLGRGSVGRWLVRAYYATLGQAGGYVHGSLALRIVAGVLLAPLVAVALLWHGLSLPGLLAMIALAYAMARYRRTLRRVLAHRVLSGATTALILTLGASRAHAGGYEPYWEDNEAVSDANGDLAEDDGGVRWHVGIRVGPYIPDIDHQAGGPKERPYHQMFGGYRILPMLDIDRILWTGFGQLGVGVSAGYMQNTAKAYVEDSMPTSVNRARATDSNTIHVVPLALTATYRFTYLDDEYAIPVVPYVRGGLAYSAWWVTVDNGNLAKVCKDGTAPDCSYDKALGGSLGYTGSIGLAIRAERIDASAATSMRQSGIQHAGIFAELSASKVDGFGSDKKLSLGDRSWFAGVNFEF